MTAYEHDNVAVACDTLIELGDPGPLCRALKLIARAAVERNAPVAWVGGVTNGASVHHCWLAAPVEPSFAETPWEVWCDGQPRTVRYFLAEARRTQEDVVVFTAKKLKNKLERAVAILDPAALAAQWRSEKVGGYGPRSLYLRDQWKQRWKHLSSVVMPLIVPEWKR